MFQLLLLSSVIHGQSVSINYNDVDIGRNVSILYHTKGGRHQFSGGIKVHINSQVHDNQNHVFRKRIYASNFKEHIGLQFGYNYNLPLNHKNRLLLFYDNQFTIAGKKGEVFLPAGFLGGTPLYEKHVIEFQELKALEQHIGIGLRTGVWEDFYLNFRIGGGVALFWDVPFEIAPNQYHMAGARKLNWEFGRLLSIGIEYELNN